MLEQQITNLDQSRKLYELGFKKPSIYYWTIPEGKWVEEYMKNNPAYQTEDANPRKPQLTDNPDFYGIYGDPVNKVGAYLLSEIMEALGDRMRIRKRAYKDTIEYVAALEAGAKPFYRKNPIEAACDLLIWCIENGFISTK